MSALWLPWTATAETGSYELRDRSTAACHSAFATELAAIAHVEHLAQTEGPESVWGLSLVQITGEGEAEVVAEGPELLELQVG